MRHCGLGVLSSSPSLSLSLPSFLLVSVSLCFLFFLIKGSCSCHSLCPHSSFQQTQMHLLATLSENGVCVCVWDSEVDSSDFLSVRWTPLWCTLPWSQKERNHTEPLCTGLCVSSRCSIGQEWRAQRRGYLRKNWVTNTRPDAASVRYCCCLQMRGLEHNT